MEIGEIFKAITTYGLSIVISGLVLFFAVKFGNIFLNDFQNKRGVKKHDELTTIRNQVGSVINALLERTVLRTRADRVYVFEFHNGSLSMGGLPFLKMTNTYEALGQYGKTELHKRADMPFLLFQTFVDAVYEKEHLVIDAENRTDEFAPLVYEILEERNIRITIRAKITDLNRKVIGYLGIDYCKGNPISREAAESNIDTLMNVATELGALLSVNDKEKKD